MDLDALELTKAKVIRTLDEGFITGSCMIPGLDEVKDIDVFVPDSNQLLIAVKTLELAGGFKLGKTDNETSEAAERMKLRWTTDRSWLESIYLYDPETMGQVNVTFKRDHGSVNLVLDGFDMSCVMRGYDIATGLTIDRRLEAWDATRRIPVHSVIFGPLPKEVTTAYPNPFRFLEVDREMASWKAQFALRQWERVIKYYERGFNTVPMAVEYIHIIIQVVTQGTLFDTVKSKTRFNEFCLEYGPLLIRNILPWLAMTNKQVYDRMMEIYGAAIEQVEREHKLLTDTKTKEKLLTS